MMAEGIDRAPSARVVCAHLALGSLLWAEMAFADKYFNPHAIDMKSLDQALVDLEGFAQGRQMPGTYRVDVFLNDRLQDTRDVTFVLRDGQLRPQLSVEALKAMGVDTEAFAALAALTPDQTVTSLGDYIPLANARLNFNQLQLHLSIPQAALAFRARQESDPATWDQGLPAFLVNYSASGSHTWQRRQDSQSSNAYLNLGTGLNLGPWRLRNTSTYTRSASRSAWRGADNQRLRDSHSEHQWQSIDTYAQRDVQGWRGQLTLGDSQTPGDVFDSVPFRGLQLASDDNMLADSLRGYAPVIRGIVASDAQVTVRQNGYVIYQRYVAPGAFVIRDIYPTSSSGSLEVTIAESDGTERTFLQPFSAVPIMQREGAFKYALTAGQYHNREQGARTPGFVQTSLIHGLENGLTLYTGAQWSADYASGLIGMGRGLDRWGSVSIDAMHARTRLPSGGRHQGQSVRVQYAKDLFESGTTLTLAGYRYSTTGFHDFREAAGIIAGDQVAGSVLGQQGHNRRSRMQAQITQSLGERGSLYLNAFQQDYWHKGGQEQTLNAGYSASFSGVTYGINLNATHSPHSRSSRQMSFSVQIPLGSSSSRQWARYGLQTDSSGNTRQQAGLNGQLLDDKTLSYALQHNQGHRETGSSGSSSLDYQGGDGRVQAGYNYSDTHRQANYSMQGGIVAHPYGVTLSQPLGQTMALVRAPGASQVNVQNQTGIRTDARGYAVVPYLSSYRDNRVALDTLSLDDDLDIDAPVTTVVPTAGAIVLADFKARVGARALIRLAFQGKPVPFGANAVLQAADGESASGIVADAGTVYLSGLPGSGRLTVTWGPAADQRCQANYQLAPQVQGGKATAVANIAAMCE
jgi:outer membrane usher protein